MAQTFPVYLDGGPCNGKIVHLTKAQLDTGKWTCGGKEYDFDPTLSATVNGFVYEAGGATGGGSNIPATGVHKGWSDLRRSLNHKMPTALAKSAKMDAAALRKLEHARKVRL